MSHVKHRTTDEQRLAVQIIFVATTRDTHSPDFIGAIFNLSRPTVLSICADTPRLGSKFTDVAVLRAGWSADRQRKGLPTDDVSWRRAVAEAQGYIGHCLAESSDRCVALIRRTAA